MFLEFRCSRCLTDNSKMSVPVVLPAVAETLHRRINTSKGTTTNNEGKHIFRYRLSLETFRYALVYI